MRAKIINPKSKMGEWIARKIELDIKRDIAVRMKPFHKCLGLFQRSSASNRRGFAGFRLSFFGYAARFVIRYSVASQCIGINYPL